MKKLLKCLSLILVFALCFTGCASKNNGNSSDGGNFDGKDDYVGPGIHETQVTATEKDFVRNGKSDYKLVIPDSYKEYEYEAASLIRNNIALSTGCLLPIVSSSAVEETDAKIISLGDTEQMRESGISLAYETLGDDGFKVVTKGETVYISGSRSPLREGTYFGAQEFLRHTVNWEAYSDTEIRYDNKNVIPLYDFVITEVPDIANRRTGYYDVIHNSQWMRNLRFNDKNEAELPFSGHSHFNVLPPKDYVHDHPEWYWWEDGKDYDAVGDAQFFIYAQLNISNEEMQEEFSRQLAKWFIENPDKNFAHLGIQDSKGYCDCDGCKAMMEQYNTNFAGISVIFTNKVARRTQELIWETDPERMISVEMFAYYSTIDPPVHEENGVLVPDCEEVIPDDNVYVQFTPLGYKIFETMDDAANAEYAAYLEGWKVLTDKISVWFYGFNWSSLIFNHNNWETVQANLRYFADNGVRRVYDQGPNNVKVVHMFELKVWVESKLMWNLSLNYDELVDEFINNYYGVAADDINEMYDLMTAYYQYAHKARNMTAMWWEGGNYFSFGYVESVRKIMERAMEKVEALKGTDSVAYDKYYWRTAAVYTENVFMQMHWYQGRYSREYGEKMIDFFEATVQKFGVTAMNEDNTRRFETNIEQWRSFYV